MKPGYELLAMLNGQQPIHGSRPGQLERIIGCAFLALLAPAIMGLASLAVSHEPVLGTIALVVWCISLFWSYRRSQKQIGLRERELRVRLDSPREGLALVDGSAELLPDVDVMTCEFTQRKCVFYSFALHEVKGSGEDQKRWDILKESNGIPFLIRSEYGTARVEGQLEPEPSTISYNGEWSKSSQLNSRELCIHGGSLRQDYVDLMPGQHVTLLGQMSVDQDGGVLNGSIEFSTLSHPQFRAINSAASVGQLPVLLLLGDVLPFVYFVWLVFDSV